MRVFFALWPEPAIQQALHAVAKTCQAQCSARSMRTESLHMTLQFIGNIKRSQLPKLLDAAASITGIAPFQMELDTLSFWKHNRIGYASPSDHIPALDQLFTSLQQSLQPALAEEHILLENTQFCPHITLLRNVAPIPVAKTFRPIMWQVNTFVLAESVTVDQRTEYRIINEWRLKGPAT